MTAMNITIFETFLSHDEQDASLAALPREA
jgi:hypothetical protein